MLCFDSHFDFYFHPLESVSYQFQRITVLLDAYKKRKIEPVLDVLAYIICFCTSESKVSRQEPSKYRRDQVHLEQVGKERNHRKPNVSVKTNQKQEKKERPNFIETLAHLVVS
jgi:hypothetical protein